MKPRSLRISSHSHNSHNSPLRKSQRVWSNSLLKLYSSPLPTGSDSENCTAGPSSVELQPAVQFLCFGTGAEEASFLLVKTSTAFFCKCAGPFWLIPTSTIHSIILYLVFSDAEQVSNYSFHQTQVKLFNNKKSLNEVHGRGAPHLKNSSRILNGFEAAYASLSKAGGPPAKSEHIRLNNLKQCVNIRPI